MGTYNNPSHTYDMYIREWFISHAVTYICVHMYRYVFIVGHMPKVRPQQRLDNHNGTVETVTGEDAAVVIERYPAHVAHNHHRAFGSSALSTSWLAGSGWERDSSHPQEKRFC